MVWRDVYKRQLNARCEQIKSQVLEVKAQVKSTAKSIVDEAKEKGRSASVSYTHLDIQSV